MLFFHGIKAWEKEKDPEKKAAIEAYLLGFACHFALDHSLHEYVNHTDDSTIFTHGEIETELDRRLLVREGMTPLRADVTSHVKNTSMTRLGRLPGPFGKPGDRGGVHHELQGGHADLC